MDWLGCFGAVCLVAGMVVAGVCDVLIIAFDDQSPTVTECIRNATEKYPVIIFFVAFLCGHLFWGTITQRR